MWQEYFKGTYSFLKQSGVTAMCFSKSSHKPAQESTSCSQQEHHLHFDGQASILAAMLSEI